MLTKISWVIILIYFVIDYKIHGRYIQIFKALRLCHRHNHDVVNCLPVLQENGLLGKGHVFKKYGYGYGLGVTFVKKGIVYEKNCELKKFNIIFNNIGLC